jgi:hypothetical protein
VRAPFVVSPFDVQLDAARQVGDPEADAVVERLGRDAWLVNAALRHAHRNDDPLPDAVPVAVRHFLAEHAAPPAWLDALRAFHAQRWAMRHVLPLTACLFCASLPTAYGAARGARVLEATGRMHGAQLDRRVNETAQFVLDVVAEGSLGPDGGAIRAVQKVRLVHAAVRAQLRRSGRAGDEVPINQEDMLGTLGSFSVVVLRSLRRLGVDVDDHAAEDFYQLWRAVGAMLGIRADLLPSDLSAAGAVCDRIAERQHAASPEGRALMASLLDGMEQHVPAALHVAPRYLVRHLVGERLADLLGVPPAGRSLQTGLDALRLLSPGRPFRSIALTVSSLVGRPLLHAVVATKLGGVPATFAMPAFGSGPRCA